MQKGKKSSNQLITFFFVFMLMFLRFLTVLQIWNVFFPCRYAWIDIGWWATNYIKQVQLDFIRALLETRKKTLCSSLERIPFVMKKIKQFPLICLVAVDVYCSSTNSIKSTSMTLLSDFGLNKISVVLDRNCLPANRPSTKSSVKMKRKLFYFRLSNNWFQFRFFVSFYPRQLK